MSEPKIIKELTLSLGIRATTHIQKLAQYASNIGMEMIAIDVSDLYGSVCASADYSFDKHNFVDSNKNRQLNELPFSYETSLEEFISAFGKKVLTPENLDQFNGKPVIHFTLSKLDSTVNGAWTLVADAVDLNRRLFNKSREIKRGSWRCRMDKPLSLILEKFQEYSITGITQAFAGGGDSGNLESIIGDSAWELNRHVMVGPIRIAEQFLEAEDWRTAKSEHMSLHTLVKRYCQKQSKSLGNWWDGDGGTGSISIDSSGCKVNVDFVYDEEIAFDVVHVKTAFPLSVESISKIPSLDRTQDMQP